MATYYVDFVGGDDTAAGTSTGTAWQHCPGDSNATDVPAGTTLAAGDIIYFKKGVIYDGMITCGQSGSQKVAGSNAAITSAGVLTSTGANFQTNGVTTACQIYIYHSKAAVTGTWVESCGLFAIASIDSEIQITLADFDGVAHAATEMTYVVSLPITYTSTSSWGSGDAVLDAEDTRVRVFVVENRDYLRFEGLRMINTATSAERRDAAVYGNVATCNHIYVVDCEFEDLGGSTTNTGDYSVLKGCTCANIYLSGFRNIDFDNEYRGRWSLVDNCSIDGATRSTWGIAYEIVRYCTIKNIWSDAPYGAFGYHGNNIGPIKHNGEYIWIYGNTFDKGVIHIAIYGDQTDKPNNIVIHSNIFIGRLEEVGTSDQAIVADNAYDGCEYVYIFNNTFFAGGGLRAWANWPIGMGNPNATYTTTKNNIIDVTNANDNCNNGGPTGWVSDYNHYKATKASPFQWNEVAKSLAQWLALGNDANGIQNLTTDPMFVNRASGAEDLRLQSGSPDINQGVDLSTYFTLDKDKNVRASWDLGAYEYQYQGITFNTSTALRMG